MDWTSNLLRFFCLPVPVDSHVWSFPTDSDEESDHVLPDVDLDLVVSTPSSDSNTNLPPSPSVVGAPSVTPVLAHPDFEVLVGRYGNRARIALAPSRDLSRLLVPVAASPEDIHDPTLLLRAIGGVLSDSSLYQRRIVMYNLGRLYALGESNPNSTVNFELRNLEYPPAILHFRFLGDAIVAEVDDHPQTSHFHHCAVEEYIARMLWGTVL